MSFTLPVRLLGWVGLAAAAWSALVAPDARAQLTLVPPIRMVRVAPGAKQAFELTVSNRSSRAVSCEVEAEDMVLDEHGRPVRAPEGYRRGCASWVEFRPQRFSLGAQKAQRVLCTVKAPRGTAGGYYARLVCLASPGVGARESGASINLHFRLVSALLVTVTGTRVYSNIVPRGVECSVKAAGNPSAGASPGWAMAVRVTNTGNVHAALDGEVRILDRWGRVAARSPLRGGRGFVLPGADRVFEARGTERLADGTYVAVATLHPPGRPTSPVSASGVFSLVQGEVRTGEPTPEVVALLEALRPLFHLPTGRIEISLAPGGRRVEMVEIVNLSDRALELGATVRDWDMDAHGAVTFPEAEPGHGRSGVAWVSLASAPVSLPPKGKGRLAVTVALPRDAEGDYYAAVTLGQTGGPAAADVSALLETSVLLRMRAIRTAKPAGIPTGFSVTQVDPYRSAFRLDVKNTGNSECFAQARVAILDARRQPVVEGLEFGSGETMILPNRLRTLRGEWQGTLPPGKYVAVVALSFDANAPSVSREIAFDVRVPAG